MRTEHGEASVRCRPCLHDLLERGELVQRGVALVRWEVAEPGLVLCAQSLDLGPLHHKNIRIQGRVHDSRQFQLATASW